MGLTVESGKLRGGFRRGRQMAQGERERFLTRKCQGKEQGAKKSGAWHLGRNNLL